MKITVLFLLFCATGMCAQPSMPADGAKRAKAFAAETIPVFELKQATFEDALAAVRRAWEQRHPDESFPVLAADYQATDELRAETSVRITMSLKNVPFIEALKYIGLCSGRRLIPRGQFFQMEGHSWIEEDWIYRAHDVTVGVLAALHLKPDSSPAEVRRAFEQFGVKFEDWMKLSVIESGRILFVIAYPSEQEKIAGILFLLRNGFKITK